MQEGGAVVAFSATGEINRRDFGVSFNHSLLDGSVVVGNKVVIELEVEAARPTDRPDRSADHAVRGPDRTTAGPRSFAP